MPDRTPPTPVSNGKRSPPGRWVVLAVLLFLACGVTGALWWQRLADAPSAATPVRPAPAPAAESQRALQQRQQRLQTILAKREQEAARWRKRLADAEAERNAPWVTVFRDDFNRDTLGPHWQAPHGNWTVRDGKLVNTQTRENDLLVCTGVDFSGDIQVAYAGRTLDGPGGKPCDMSFFIGGAAQKPDPGRCYLFRFGSYNNQWSGLSRPRGPDVRNPAVRIEKGKTHRVVLQRLGNHCSLVVDGTPVVAVAETDPVRDPALRGGGFYVWDARVEIDWIEVCRPVRMPPVPEMILPHADRPPPNAEVRREIF